MPSVRGPLLVVWGSNDSFTPIDGPVGKLFRALPGTRPHTEFHELPGELLDLVFCAPRCMQGCAVAEVGDGLIGDGCCA